MEILFAVGFLCGMQNVVGGAAYQVLLAQMAGRKRLVEANAKVDAGRNLGGADRSRYRRRADPCADRAVRDRARCDDVFRLRADAAPDQARRNDVARDGANGGVWREIGEGLKLVWGNRTLWALAWLAGIWQFLHHMQVAVLILFATRDLGLSAGAIGLAYVFGGAGLRARVGVRPSGLSARFGIGPVIVHGLILTAFGWQAYGLIGGPPWLATLAARDGDAGVRLRRDPVRDQLSVAAAGDHARPAARTHDGDDALCHRRVRADRLAGRRRAGDVRSACASTLLTVGVLGLLLSAAAVLWSPVRRHRTLPDPLID